MSGNGQFDYGLGCPLPPTAGSLPVAAGEVRAKWRCGGVTRTVLR